MMIQQNSRRFLFPLFVQGDIYNRRLVYKRWVVDIWQDKIKRFGRLYITLLYTSASSKSVVSLGAASKIALKQTG
jgi:hypothetical protein